MTALGGWLAFPRYTFLISGPVLYRCDRWTGNVDAGRYNYNAKDYTWKSIKPELATPEDVFDRLPGYEVLTDEQVGLTNRGVWLPPETDPIVVPATNRALFTDADFPDAKKTKP